MTAGLSARYAEIARRIESVVETSTEADELMQIVCEVLSREIAHYDWVGFYLRSGNELLLGPYVGEPTEHMRIPIGRGICGQAAARRETFLIADVRLEANYLSCSPMVRSEIVVPVMAGDEVIGEIDIDSHTEGAFTEDDRRLLESIAETISPVLSATQPRP